MLKYQRKSQLGGGGWLRATFVFSQYIACMK